MEQSFGNYKIEQLIRESPQSKVYLVADENGTRRFLKTASLEDITNEVRIIEKANSNKVVTLSYYDLQAKHPYLVTENAGLALSQLKLPLELQEFRTAAIELFNALEEIHSKNIIHGDLKPGNVLYDAGKIKLCDFAGSLDQSLEHTLTRTGALTFGYIPPEIEKGQQPTTQSDIYQAGLIAYELCSGQPMRPHSPPIDSLCVPNDLKTLFKELIAKDPKDRPSAKSAANRIKQSINPHNNYLVQQNTLLQMEVMDLEKEKQQLTEEINRRKRRANYAKKIIAIGIIAYAAHAYFYKPSAQPSPDYWFRESANSLTFPVNLDSSGGSQRTIPIEPGTTVHLTQLLERAEVNDKQSQSQILYDSARNIRRQTYTPSQVERILYTLQDENGVITQERVRTALRAVRTTNQGFEAIIAAVSSRS